MSSISVIIPTCNREAYLPRALRSVAVQTLPCSELIVVDDGSTDSTAEIVASFATRCRFPVIYLYQGNSGPAAARNTGIVHASNTFLAFLDSDDHWTKKKLQIQYDTMQKAPEILVCHTAEKWLRRGIHLNQKKIHQPRNGDIFDHCLKLCAVGMSTVMARKEFFERVGQFNEELPCCEDYDLWLRASSLLEFLLVDIPLTVKEGGREDQVSFQYRMGMDRFRIFSILYCLHNESLTDIKRELALAELAKKSRVFGQGCVKHGQTEKGKQCLEISRWAKSCLEEGIYDKMSREVGGVLGMSRNLMAS